MKDGKLSGFRGAAQPNPFFPARMAKPTITLHLLLAEGRVIDDQIGMIDEPQDVLVELSRHMLGVGDIAGALASEFYAIAHRTIGMVETAGVDDNAVMGSQHVAGLEVLVFDVGD